MTDEIFNKAEDLLWSIRFQKDLVSYLRDTTRDIDIVLVIGGKEKGKHLMDTLLDGDERSILALHEETKLAALQKQFEEL